MQYHLALDHYYLEKVLIENHYSYINPYYSVQISKHFNRLVDIPICLK